MIAGGGRGRAWSGKVVYLSGGTSGINLGIAKEFAGEGARVLVFGRSMEKADAASHRLRASCRHRASMMVTLAMPPPSHIVCSP